MTNESQPKALIACLGKDGSCRGCFLAEYAAEHELDPEQKADLRRVASLAGQYLLDGNCSEAVAVWLESDVSGESRLPEDAPSVAVRGYLEYFLAHSKF